MNTQNTQNIRLEAPDKHKRNVSLWVDEAIWGHRLHNEQTPWLILLEFLAIFQDRNAKHLALDEKRQDDKNEDFTYSIPQLIPLRQLIFNNPHIRHVNATQSSNESRWQSWLKAFDPDDKFRYLEKKFCRSFTDLYHVIDFFQKTAIEPHRQRRWSSRFLFPYGPNCLYADLPADLKAPDRIFFARSGELLYLMLNRSGSGPEIADLISKKFLRGDNTWNRVITTLLPDDTSQSESRIYSEIGYLPYASHPEYKELAETWKRLLRLNLPGEALLDPLMRLSALHMLLYMLRNAKEEVGDTDEPNFLLEIASPRRTTLFELSVETLNANKMLSSRAVLAHVESAKDDDRWRSALQARLPEDDVRKYLKEQFGYSEKEPSSGDPDTILETLRSEALKRHRQHVAGVHLEWTKRIGLTVSSRGTGTWYSPDDSLLKALVMCTVDEGREEYYRFLARLHERFRIVIGASEAERAFNSLPTDQNAFTQNTQRLEQRLQTLGLLRRLSDDCAYVENPFRSRS